MTRTTKKGNLWFLVELTFKWYEAAMVFHIFTFIFLVLEPTVKKNTWMRTISITAMVIISKVLL